jgi:DNA-binding FadR family transcriptional regulator
MVAALVSTARVGKQGKNLRDMTNVGTKVRVPKSAELVATSLRQQIVRGELVEGDGLPSEAVLMGQFGVSRPTLREAFRVLESEQLITVHRGVRGGARVHVPNGDVAARYAALVLQHRGTTLQDVYLARSVIEPACVRILAERRTAKDLKTLKAVLAAAQANVDAPGVSPEVTQFHQLIVELAGNQTLIVLTGMVQHILELAAMNRVTAPESAIAGKRALRKGVSVHEQLVALIEQRDADGAEKLWARHLEETASYVLAGISGKTVLDLLE